MPLASSLGSALHDLDFFQRQAVECIHQLVHLLLQHTSISLGVALLRCQNTLYQIDDWSLLCSLENEINIRTGVPRDGFVGESISRATLRQAQLMRSLGIKPLL